MSGAGFAMAVPAMTVALPPDADRISATALPFVSVAVPQLPNCGFGEAGKRAFDALKTMLSLTTGPDRTPLPTSHFWRSSRHQFQLPVRTVKLRYLRKP